MFVFIAHAARTKLEMLNILVPLDRVLWCKGSRSVTTPVGCQSIAGYFQHLRQIV